jgi:putative protein-disulfide isomerase
VKEEQLTNDTLIQHEAEQVEIIYYTDPLCCWSWALEPQWRKLRYEFAGKIKWQYVMGGLLPSWKNYNDEVNSVSRPIQMGPIWMQVNHVSGMPIPNKIWMVDPPASSYPACIAVKCAQLQSSEAGEIYLRLVREAIMIHEKNIAKQEVLIEVAEQIANNKLTTFDLARFKDDLKNDNGIEAFRKDIQEVQYRNINRFPTLILRQLNQQAVIITGYRPYSALLTAINQVAPNLKKVHTTIDAEAYKQYWGSITQKEVDEALAQE